MKKFSSIVLAFVLILAGYNLVNAKNNKESTTITVDYTTLDSETVVELEAKTNYQIEFINLPANISSTQLKKQFSGKFMNIRGKREKVSDASSSHRVRVKKARPGFEGTVRLKLYEKVNSENDDDSSDDNGDTSSFRTGDDDNVLVETIQFTLSVAGASDSDSNNNGNGDTSSSDIEIDYNNLTSSTTVQLEDSTKSISFINLPSNITSTKLKKNISGKFVNIRGKREKVTNNSSSHRVKIKKKKRSFEGTATFQLFEKSDDSSSDDNGDTSSFRTDDDDNILVESIEFTLLYVGSNDSDNDDDSGDNDDSGDDDDSDDNDD